MRVQTAPHSTRRPRPRKRFGQHFLLQPEIARRIVALAGLEGTETVLEIGPGRGALSRMLAEKCGRLVLVEIDRDLAAEMEESFRSDPHVSVVAADVLRADLATLLGGSGPVTVVANLPYNISTPALMKLLESPERFRRLVLMLQKEVAERLAAPPGGKEYGALSVMVQSVAGVRTAFTVPPGAFTPRPKVDSAVVLIEPLRPQALEPAERQALRTVVRAAFSQRRKQLGNGLASVFARPAEVLRELGIDPQRRPETLSVEEFVGLALRLRAQGA